ncbi:MAG: class I SAM-dependent methyltransferase [Bacteroidota bacterium]
MTFQKDPEQNETRYLHKFADLTNRRVLEIGTGEGRLTWRYAGQAANIIAIDPDKDALRVAMIDRPSDLEKKVQFPNAVAEHLPFSRETFDIALLAWSF